MASMTVRPLEDQRNQCQRPLETLRSLSLNGPNCFTTSGLSRPNPVLWDCFAFVEELNIVGCDELVRWPVEELRSLVHLRYLVISLYDNLNGKGSSSEEILPLPQLKRLHIEGCVNLLEMPKLLASLEQLQISCCVNLGALPSNLGDLAKLRELTLYSCNGLKLLPNRMDGVASLDRLTIGYCPGIEKLSEGLLQRLPTLRSLCVQGCPDLGRRCREGGWYFHLVSSVPDKVIQVAEHSGPAIQTSSNRKNFVRRLLPFCADSN
ncbi:hypothetical protein ACQ4PT_020612 [Festuca glaucescens]